MAPRSGTACFRGCRSKNHGVSGCAGGPLFPCWQAYWLWRSWPDGLHKPGQQNGRHRAAGPPEDPAHHAGESSRPVGNSAGRTGERRARRPPISATSVPAPGTFWMRTVCSARPPRVPATLLRPPCWTNWNARCSISRTAPRRSPPPSLESLQRRIENEGLLFKVRIISSNIHHKGQQL